MPEVLALHWDRRYLSGVEFSPTSSGPRVDRGFKIEWPEKTPTADWLRESLKRQGISARQVMLALPREDAVLRLLELPTVGDDELPTLVRFQAAARSAQPIDQLLLDYLPLPSRPGISQKEVWLITTLQSTVESIRSMLTEAGLELTHLTLSSFCLTELIARKEARQNLDATGASLIVLRDGARMELAVICQRQLVAAHAVNWSSVNELPPASRMLSEVSRALVQIQAWLPEGTLQRAWIIGDDADVGDLPGAIHERWNCPVERFDPHHDSSAIVGRSGLAGGKADHAIALGLAHIAGGALCPKLDLLHPRQPPPKRDPRKPYYAAAAAAGLLVTAIVTAIVQQSLASYDTDIAKLLSEQAKLLDQLKKDEPTFAAAKELEEWQSRNINQLKQIAELHQVMNGTQKMVIGEYDFSPAAGNVLGKLKLNGKARERADFEDFSQNLAQLAKFAVPPTPFTPTNEPDYAGRFKLEVDLVPAKQKPPATQAIPPAGAKPGGTK